MEPINKILFAYPVRYKPEMTNEECCIPMEHLPGIERGTKLNIIVTAGLMVSLTDGIFINIVIDGPGEAKQKPDIAQNGQINNLKTSIFPNEQGIFLTSMIVENTSIDETGIHEIIVQLYKADDKGNKAGFLLDTFKSYFYVSVAGNV